MQNLCEARGFVTGLTSLDGIRKGVHKYIKNLDLTINIHVHRVRDRSRNRNRNEIETAI